MNSKYEIVKYRPEFKSQTLELQTHLWSPDLAVNAAYLEWKYRHNPYIDTPLIYLASCAGQVVGIIGMYGAQWQIGHPSQTFLGLCAGDLVIAPDQRNRGLFTRLMRTALDDLANMGYTYVFSLSANPVSRLGCLMMGWRSVGSLQTMYWGSICHRGRRYASKRLFISSAEKQHPFYSLDRNGAQRRFGVSPYVSFEQTPRPEAMAELVERIGSDGRIRHVRDQEYFAWRFSNPLSLYRFLFWEDTRMEGYLVLQTRLHKDKVKVNIIDWETSNAQVRADLLQAAIRLGNFDDLNIWSATLSEGVKALLQNTGFNLLDEARSVTHERSTVLVRPVRDEMLKADWVFANRRLLDLADWDLRMVYSDNY